ncbi:MAG: Gx transporter family protein [Clostridia bacterium]|nr:Gx transporter family protein [Clostridia bacterium]
MSAKPTDSTYNKRRQSTRSDALKAAAGGVALATAMILSYVETLIPFNIGIPGIKVGLPNLIILFVLYKYGFGYAAAVSLLRVALAGILFGSVPSFIYSVAGAVISLGVMVILKKTDLFSPAGVSVAGGITHNLAQICAAAILMNTADILYYLPALVIGGTVSGALIGITGSILIKKINFANKI